MKEKKEGIIIATITEALPNTMFRCVTDIPAEEDGEPEEMIAFLAGKMRLHRIRVLVGDKVEIQTDPYGGKGRIIRRL